MGRYRLSEGEDDGNHNVLWQPKERTVRASDNHEISLDQLWRRAMRVRPECEERFS